MNIEPSPEFIGELERKIRQEFRLPDFLKFDAKSPRIVIPYLRGELTRVQIIAERLDGDPDDVA
jgi:hypothetical protein